MFLFKGPVRQVLNMQMQQTFNFKSFTASKTVTHWAFKTESDRGGTITSLLVLYLSSPWLQLDLFFLVRLALKQSTERNKKHQTRRRQRPLSLRLEMSLNELMTHRTIHLLLRLSLLKKKKNNFQARRQIFFFGFTHD